MLTMALWLALTAVGVALLLTAWRLWLGPDAVDRVLALDKLYINAAALLTLLGIHFDSGAFFDAALLITLLGFIGTVALSRFLLRGRPFD